MSNTKKSKCPQCEGKLKIVNGILYQCENGHTGDSTFGMITEEMKKFEKGIDTLLDSFK